MMAGGLCYVTYILCFLHPIPELLYTCAFIGGVGGGLVWIAQGPELVVNSTEKTMNRNSAIFWVLYMGGSLFGNIYVFVAWRGKDDVSASEQTTLAILLAAVSFAGVLMLLFKTDF